MSSAHLELAVDARLIIYDSWDGLRNFGREETCAGTVPTWGGAHGEPGREALCKSGSHGYSSICPGAEGVATGHTRAWAPSALKAGHGWWPALVSALPHVKPHVGIGGDQKGEGCSRRGLGPPSRTQEA